MIGTKFRINRILLFVCILSTITVKVFSQPVETGNSSELKIDKHEIYPTIYNKPFPVGEVDVNPPFLHYRKEYSDIKERNREKLNTLFYFRMAKNKEMTNLVYESGVRKWSFYSPYSKLDKGNWFWQCGMAKKENPKKIIWSDVFSFRISGNERVDKWPSYKVLEENLINAGHPRILCKKSEVGTLLPKDLKLKRGIVKILDKALKKEMSPTFMDFSKWNNPKVRKSGTSYRQKAISNISSFEKSKLMPMIRGFLLTGDKQYLNEGLEAFKILHKGYKELENNNLAKGFVVDIYGRALNNTYDSYYNYLPPSKRAIVLEELTQSARKTFVKLLDNYEHIPHNEHAWQSFIRSSIYQIMTLVGEVDEASEWMEYLYDLWNLKMPGAGRSDGGWYTGNGYFNASVHTQFGVPYMFSRYTGVDFFNHPWYQNVGKYLSYTTLPNHPSGGYGDKAGRFAKGVVPMLDMIRNLRYIHPDNPWNQRYYETMKAFYPRSESPGWFLLSDTKWYELLLRKKNPEIANKTGYKKIDKQAALFNDIGYVAMFTDMDDIKDNAMISFRSCPFGQSNHAHAAQNAFNMTWQGKKLFFRTGYYTSSNDTFSVPNYKHSRASNTILVDGMGTSMSHSGYGWIARYLNGKNIAYTLGDASNAFTGEFGPYGKMLEKREIAVVPENGYGNPEVTKFRRHMVFLRPNILLVYDELEAKKPVTWTFRLNAVDEISKIDESSVAVKAENATATAKVFTLTGTNVMVTDQFWGGKAVDFQNKLSTTKNQFHVNIDTKNKTVKERLLTVIKINPDETNPTKPLKISNSYSGSLLNLTIEGWTISAEMDAEKPSLLSAKDKNNAILTGSDTEQISVDGKVFKVEQKGETLLLEKSGNKFIEQKAIDRFPDAAIYN